MPKLLIVATTPLTLRAFLLPFGRHFRARGFRVDAMAQGASGCSESAEAFDKVSDVDWSRNPLDFRNLLKAPRQIREVVEREQYDLVHVHTPVAAFVTRFALRGLRARGGPRVIYTAHGFHFYRGAPAVKAAVFRSIERLAGAWTDYLVVINREDEEAAHRYRLVPDDRIRYMPGIGVDLAAYHPDAVPEAEVLRVRREMGLGEQDRLLLMIAEFNPGKRHRDALAAFARLNRPGVHLAFAGLGPLQEQMQELARTLAVANRVHFLGFRRDIPALLRTSTALLLPSEREGLPRSVMEALSLSVPVIGSRIRGMTDLLEDGCGFLFPTGDTIALADALARVLDHPDEARAAAKRGRERMAGFDLKQVVRLHESLYEEALQTTAPEACGV